MKSKITVINMVSSLLLQMCTIISGFIIPRIILSYFGSDVNGLVSSINQFLSYIALVEGGITGVIAANLYGPIVANDQIKLSSVLTTSKRFFHTVGAIFIAYSILLGILYPVLMHLDFRYTFLLTLILSINLFVQYMFSITLKTLLNADKKIYVVSFTQIIIIICNILLVYLSVRVYPSIHVVKLISGLLYILQPVVFNAYVRKHYTIDWKAPYDNNLIKQRWNGFAINLAAFFHNSTDITVLTIFSTLASVSVYSVYVLVTNGLKTLIQSFASGLNPTIGHAYAKKDWADLNRKLDLYEYIVLLITFFLFSMAGLLITPFVSLYTKGINDAQYSQPLFGYLIVIAEGLYLIKLPHLNLAYSANRFREITVPAFVEAAINILISVLLVGRLGLVGVAVGTICGMLYRMAFHVAFTRKIIPDRGQMIFYRKLFLFSIAAIIGIAICRFTVRFEMTSFGWWMLGAVLYGFVLLLAFGALSMLYFRQELTFFRAYLFKRSK